MDYIEIQQLVNKLSFALDYCTNGGKDFADLFIKGGQCTIDEGNGNPLVFHSREQLVAVAGGPDCKADQVPPRSYIRHLSESLVIEASPGGAQGRSYAVYPASKDKYLKEDVAGDYLQPPPRPSCLPNALLPNSMVISRHWMRHSPFCLASRSVSRVILRMAGAMSPFFTTVVT